MTIDYDPNAPAFAPLPEQVKTEEPTVEEPATSEESVVEEKRVPYSRFEKVYESAREAREEADRYRAEADALRTSNQTVIQSEDLPDYWVELFGDSDASKKAFKADQQRIAVIEEKAENRAIEALERRQSEASQRIESNLNSIDERLEVLSDYIGRDITADEESAILDIVDDFTPKNDDGSYAGALLPFDKAWDIYEMKQQQTNAKSKQSRNAVSSVSASQSQGTATATESSITPGRWNSNWRNRITGN